MAQHTTPVKAPTVSTFDGTSGTTTATPTAPVKQAPVGRAYIERDRVVLRIRLDAGGSLGTGRGGRPLTTRFKRVDDDGSLCHEWSGCLMAVQLAAGLVQLHDLPRNFVGAEVVGVLAFDASDIAFPTLELAVRMR